MNEDNLKSLWKNSSQKETISFNQYKIVSEMNDKMIEFEKSIKKRNMREIIAAIVVIIFFSIQTIRYELFLQKLGAGLAVLAAVFIIFKLLHIQNSKKPITLTGSIKEQLQHSKDYLLREQKLLKSVLFWYVLPLMVPLFIITIGSDYPLGIQIAYLVFILGVSIFVYYINHKAAKKLDTQLLELDDAIRGVE